MSEVSMGSAERTPVAVVGAGACGMVAALSAAREGVPVVLLDKGDELAGNTARSTGFIPAAGTRFQREAGILDDSPELMATDILRKNGYQNEDMARLLCEEAAPLVEWLVDEVGCDLICHTEFLYPGQSRLRTHGPPEGYGAELTRQLGMVVCDEPLVDFRPGTPALGLVSQEGCVVGVKTSEGEVRADAVVLALNGFGGDREMLREYLGEEATSALYYGSPNNTEEGIHWGIQLGADTEHMDAYQGFAAVAVPDGPVVSWSSVVNGAIIVNRYGLRFGNELVGYSEFAGEVLAQPGGEGWEILDSEVYEASQGTRFDQVIEAGKVARGKSVEELAKLFRLSVETLSRTIEEVNRAARGEAPDPFGRSYFAGGPLEPPLYEIHVRGALFHTQDGQRIDDRARVVRHDAAPIPGLYAGGGTAAGVSGSGYRGYSSGNGLLAATVLGRIAGRTAAATVATGRS